MADDPVEALRRRFSAEEKEVTTSRLGRLWKTGRSAASLGTAVLGGRLRGRGEGLAAADVEAIARLAARLGELKGVAMKAGQILGYIDVTLPPELRGLLSLLQTSAPASPFEKVRATIEEALGERAAPLLAGLERAPVAVASIGQVHRGRLPDGAEVAVKVRHAGILEAMRADLRSAGGGAQIASLIFPGARRSVSSFIEEARTALIEECDYRLEAERQAAFGAIFRDHPVIRVPAVRAELSAESVLVSAWLPGASLDELLARDPSQEQRDALGVALFDFYVGTLYRHGLFHADPHPGNYGLLEGGRVVVYDYGCVRRFPGARLLALAGLVAAVRSDSRRGVEEALAALGARPPRDDKAYDHLRDLLRGFLAPLLRPGPQPVSAGAGFEAQRILSDKRALMRIELPGDLLFLFRLRFGLYAVLARLQAVADWSALESRWADGALAA